MQSIADPMNFELTPSQRIAVDSMKVFLKKRIGYSFDERVLVLKGKAGTGKTTILRVALWELIQEDLNNPIYKEHDYFSNFENIIPNVIGVTVSHKAKIRLQSSIPNATTYAGYFGLKPVYASDGKVRFEKDRINPTKTLPHQIPFLVVAHDEVSMYGMDYVNFIEEYTHSNSKIILVGDPNQLPPIVEDRENVSDMDSPVFFYFSNQVTLTERVRQTFGNPIVDLSDAISEEIEGKHNTKRILDLIKTDKYNNGIGYRSIKRTEVIKDYISHYVKDDQTRIICYTNVGINAMNKQIRKKLIPHADQMYVKGDAIYMNKTYPVSKEKAFYNSEEFVIQNIEITKHMGLKCYKMYLEKDSSSFCYVVHEDSIAAYKQIILNKEKEAKAAPPKSKARLFVELKIYKENFADISYGYAFTAYKAQGSGFTNVYVDVANIFNCGLSNKRALQALYTAITRATHQVIFL